jgi:tRNA(Ile)-lysidine synthase
LPTAEFKLSFDPYDRLFVAYSGGIDSHVLLHLCAINAELKDKITAVYINHGLQVASESWGQHCKHVCNNLSVKFLCLSVNAQAAVGESPEEAARNARYAALEPLLTENDALLVAQHAEDQLEAVLLQLFRGSGLKGLSGMPERMAFGKGWLIRPLLAISKAAIVDYAQSHQLAWVEDPSNRDSKYARNFLRNDVIPKLKQQWPELAKTVSRSAQHCANAEGLLVVLAEKGFAECVSEFDNTLQISCLQVFPKQQQRLILRQWFQHTGLKLPSAAFIERIFTEVISARPDAMPVLQFQSYSIRRFRGRLYCVKPLATIDLPEVDWPKSQSQIHFSDDLVYGLIKSSFGIPLQVWDAAKITVKFRSGGEAIRLPGRHGLHLLKNLFQEAAIPPWQRFLIPLVYLDGKLAAVGELWVSADFYTEKDSSCFSIIRVK